MTSGAGFSGTRDSQASETSLAYVLQYDNSAHTAENGSYGDSAATSTYPINPYPTAFPYGNGMVLHFYQQQESSTTKTVHKVINMGLKAYV